MSRTLSVVEHVTFNERSLDRQGTVATNLRLIFELSDNDSADSLEHSI